MSEPSLISNPLEFGDRRTGLLVFGILEILLGGMCVLLLVLLLVVFALAASSARVGTLGGYGFAGEVDWHGLRFAAVVYGLLAVAFVWLGIGSIHCRRWARALSLILSWSWLLGGISALCFFVVFQRAFIAKGMITPAANFIMGVIWGFQAIVLVALPSAMVLFYQSRHVKATCEARDQTPRWTDACPMPVLATSLWIYVGAFSLLTIPFLYHSVVPFFGMLITGRVAACILVLCSALWFYLGWGTYRLKPAAWWLMLIVFGLSSASAAFTFLRIDLMDLYRRLGYGEEQIRMMQDLGFFTGRSAAWWSALFFFAFLLYSLWIRKYFTRRT
jgi:hypothetical protein